MKVWQVIAIPFCMGIWLFIAAANLDAMSALAGDAVLFDQYGVTITARHAYAVASVSADALLAITALAVFWQAGQRRWARASFALVAWVICAAVSWHSMWLWLGKNQHGNIVESTQSRDVYEATKVQFDDAQKHYSWLTQTKTSKMGPKTLAAHTAAVKAAEDRLDELRRQLAATDIKVAAKPIPYFDVLGASLLLVLNTICWPGIFGPRHRRHDAVAGVVAPAGGTAAAPPVSGMVPAQVAPQVAGSVTLVVPPEKLNEIIAATPPPPSPVAGSVAGGATEVAAPSETPKVAGSVAGSDDPEPPPPARAAPAATSNVITIVDAQGPAVRRWARARTERDPDAFAKSSELWDDYRRHGTTEMRRDEFFKLVAVELGGPVKKKAGRGYEGVRLKAEAKRQATT